MPGVTRRGTSDGQINWVSAYQLTPENADAAIAAEILHFNKLGVEFEWKLFSFDEPKTDETIETPVTPSGEVIPGVEETPVA